MGQFTQIIEKYKQDLDAINIALSDKLDGGGSVTKFSEIPDKIRSIETRKEPAKVTVYQLERDYIPGSRPSVKEEWSIGLFDSDGVPKYFDDDSVQSPFIFEEVESGTYTIVMEFSEWEGGQNLESKTLFEWLKTKNSCYILKNQEIKSGETYEYYPEDLDEALDYQIPENRVTSAKLTFTKDGITKEYILNPINQGVIYIARGTYNIKVEIEASYDLSRYHIQLDINSSTQTKIEDQVYSISKLEATFTDVIISEGRPKIVIYLPVQGVVS